MICGLAMATAQTGITAVLARRVRDTAHVAVGFRLVGANIGRLPFARVTADALATAAASALGGTRALVVALITPNLTAFIATRVGARSGGALGVQGAANRPGQLGGRVLGRVLLGWHMEAPCAVAAVLLVLTGFGVAWRARTVVGGGESRSCRSGWGSRYALEVSSRSRRRR